MKNMIKSNLSAVVQESLDLAENYETISEDKMNILEQKYQFHEDSLSYLPKFMKTYFSDQTPMVNALESLLEDKKYSSYLKVLEQSSIFSPIVNPFSNQKKSSQNVIMNFEKSENSDDIVIFSKTFYICREYEDIYQSETFQLKNLYFKLKYIIQNIIFPRLENLAANWKILISTMGLWISGIDNLLLRDLMSVGAPELLVQFYKDYKLDMSQNDVSLAFIGQINSIYNRDLVKIERKTTKDNQFNDFLNFNPTRIKLEVNLNEIDSSANDEKNQLLKNIEKDCNSWACKFFFVLQNKIDKLNINLTQFNISNPFDKNALLQNLAEIFSNSDTMIQTEQLKTNPLSLTQFLFDPPLKFPENGMENNISCILELETNFQENYAKIKYKNKEKGISGTNQNNSLLLIIIDNSCQRNFLRFRTFQSTQNDFLTLNRFLQEQDSGSILGFVQFGYFNWSYVISTSLSQIFQFYGFMDFSKNPNFLTNSNLAFIGKKGLNVDGLIIFSLNSKAVLNIDICNNYLFNKCETRILYIRSMGNPLNNNSPMNMRIVYLNDDVISKNEFRGLNLMVLGCSENSDEISNNNDGNYKKFFEKNFDLWSDGELLSDLNNNLKELITKSYYGTPLFVLSSFGNFDYYVSEDSEDWIEFNFLYEKLGGSSLISYFKQKNNIVVNGRTMDFGHPFILVGSPKFETLRGFEYIFTNDADISPSQTNIELMIDLNQKKLQCPQPFSNFRSLKETNNENNLTERSNKIFNQFSQRINEEMPKILRYKQPKQLTFNFKEDLSSMENSDLMAPVKKTEQNYEDIASDEAINEMTQEILKKSKRINDKFQNTSNQTNHTNNNDTLFPRPQHPGTNPCVKIVNSSSHILIKNETITQRFENLTYNLYIRGI